MKDDEWYEGWRLSEGKKFPRFLAILRELDLIEGGKGEEGTCIILLVWLS